MTTERKNKFWTIILIITAVFALVSAAFLVSGLIPPRVPEPLPTAPPAPTEPVSYTIMDSFDSYISEDLNAAQEAALAVKKVYWIPEDAEIAPKPNAACYGETDDPSSLQWLLDDAAEILDGQELLFSTDVELYPNSVITYYLDESIFVITWLEVRDSFAYTFTEVKISHPSQFRRYLANNEYNSDYMHPVSRMGTHANAVVASSADYYRARGHGIITYQGEVKRSDYAELVDVCFIDKNGDLIFVRAGELIGVEAAQKFVDEHEIDFSLSFGPVLVEDGVRCEPPNYFLGEVNDEYPRVALCQKDKLHYVLAFANGKDCYWNRPSIHDFAEQIDTLGVQKAYTLDGGQTGTVAMQGKALNPVQSHERWISDIIYFATAIPSPEEVPETTTEATEP